LLAVDQWSDPSSVLVNSQKDNFQPVAALLKSWSVPFDIIRLDQQHLDDTYLFDRSGGVRYSVVIWLADARSYADQNIASLNEASAAGTGLIVVHSRFLDPDLNKLLGLKYKQDYGSMDPFRLVGDQFITRDFAGKNVPSMQEDDDSSRAWVTPTTAKVLVTQGQHPLVTLNQVGDGAPSIWLGATTLTSLSSSVFWRSLFFRSLVWSMGYVVVPNADYTHRIILELDDWGTADKGFLSYWHYPEPDKDIIRRFLIRPLQQHHAIASAMVNTGYVNRQTKRIESPWTQKFTDAFGLQQDFPSTRDGLKEGVAEGALDIESHGWSHMQPDLESAPGPWWTGDLDGESSLDGWYVEFQDRLRGKEVPAASQLYHMERSLAELQQDFGIQPLELKPGGDAWSKSQFNNTAALAATENFGLFHGDIATYYLDHHLVLDMESVVPDFDTFKSGLHPEVWPTHADGPLILGFHDRDIAMNHGYMDELFAALPAGYHTMGTNEYIGILHTQVDGAADDHAWQLTFTPDNHYSVYFANHPSSWQLWLSDPLRDKFGHSRLALSIDGQNSKTRSVDVQHESLTIDVPPGLRTHTWRLAPSGKQ
jgi:hypothetical protein